MSVFSELGAFNRTILELKRRKPPINLYLKITFNRTILELKQFTGDGMVLVIIIF